MSPKELIIRLYNRYESIDEIKHYYGILAIYALCRIADDTHDQALIAQCQKILHRFPDRIQHPYYNFPSYRIAGIARAYMFMCGHDAESQQLVAHYADEMMSAARDPQGIMKHPKEVASDLIWIDVAMAVTPYLLFAGLALHNDRYIDEAAKQTFLMYDAFLDHSNGLLHQAKNFMGPGLISHDHWSRGNGWGYIALTELIQYLPANSPHRAKAEKYFRDLSAALLLHQNKRGLWRQEIPLPSAWEESSGTGLILYGFGVGIRLGLLPKSGYMSAFERGVKGLSQYCIEPDFSTLYTCEGCLCPGQGDQKGTVQAYLTDKSPRKNDGHSWGPFMLAFDEARRLGIADLPLMSAS